MRPPSGPCVNVGTACAATVASGLARTARGTPTRVSAISTYIARSQRRKLPGDGEEDKSGTGERDGQIRADAEVRAREPHTDQLGDDREHVQGEKVAEREGAPATPEALEDQPRVTRAGDSAEARDHLLVDEQHRGEQQQWPEQVQSVVLAGLCVDRDASGVVVGSHDDQSGPHQREQRAEPPPMCEARGGVVSRDTAERAFDVALVSRVEHRSPLRRQAERAGNTAARASTSTHSPAAFAARGRRRRRRP